MTGEVLVEIHEAWQLEEQRYVIFEECAVP